MSNKKIITEVYNNKFDKKLIKNDILLKYDRNRKDKMKRVLKYDTVSLVVVAVCLGLFFNNFGGSLESSYENIVKVYAYTYKEDERIGREELKDNVKIELEKYNLAMSSVPGYPIMFEIYNLDYIDINVLNGYISYWNKDTYEVSNLGSDYRLYNSKNLYFNINDKTNIQIKGIKDNKELFEKNIEIFMDNDFNYYAIMK